MWRGEMELANEQRGLLGEYLDSFRSLVGDRRTEQVLRGTVQGIIGAETLICAKIASYSAELATGSKNGEQRVRRMVKGETTQSSDLDADHLIERLQARGVEQLRDEDEVWVIIDPSELRKPYAKEMPDLMRVRALKGEGTVPGYRTLNVLGVGKGGRRGILYHRLFTSQEEDFLSESKEIQDALHSVGEALADRRGKVTWLADTQFDDEAVWGTVWEQGNHLVCRVKHQERLVESYCARMAGDGQEGSEGTWQKVPIVEAKGQAQEIARVRTDLVVRKRGQKYEKRQPVTAVIAACPIRVRYQVDVRSRKDGPVRKKDVWLVEVTLENVGWEPWILLTDWPVTDEEGALKVFRMYRQRWAVEDSFKFTKQVLGWEDVQLLHLEGVRMLVALGWVAAGFLYELGVTLEWPEVRLLGRLGGWTQRKDRPPGKTMLTNGLQRLLDHMATEAILQDEITRYGQLPPRLAAMLGRGH
jgi:hypothetical protein